MKLRHILIALLVVELFVLYDSGFGLPDPFTPVWERVRSASTGQPTVVFVVLDTVRADHTSLCGYERPTTPFLESLREDGAAVSCRAYAPGSWTMPSHASFFTGEVVPEHGVHFVEPTDEDRRVFEGTGFYTRGLDETHPTLAEHFADRGYQTLSVSANPLIAQETGLTRGFEHVYVENSPGWKVVRNVTRRLRWTLDRDKPLFLFVNLGDAHEPWEPTPSGLDWVPPRDGIGWGGPWSRWGLHDYLPWLYPRTDTFDRLVRRELDAEEKDAWIAHVTDVYDHGTYLADQAVQQLVERLEGHGWARDGLRLVVTSDHGEHLGEHDLGDHGRFVYEPVVRVPVVHWSSAGVQPLPELMAGADLYHLVKTGSMPQTPSDVVSYAFPDVGWDRVYGRGGETSVSAVASWDKVLWHDGAMERYDLATDPLETSPTPVEPEALGETRPILERALEAVEGADLSGGGLDADMAAALKEIGYVE